MLLIAQKTTIKGAFGYGLFMGTITNVGGFYFITELLTGFGELPFAVAIILHLLLSIQQGLVFAIALSLGKWFQQAALPEIIAYPVAMVVAETIIPLIFPWHFGNSQWLFLPFVQIAELGGAELVTLALISINSGIFALFVRRKKSLRQPIAAFLIFALTIGFGIVRIRSLENQMEQADSLHIGMVQANIAINTKGDSEEFLRSLHAHHRLSSELAAEEVELILWPETMFEAPFYYQSLEQTQDPQQARASAEPIRYLNRFATWLPANETPIPETPNLNRYSLNGQTQKTRQYSDCKTTRR